MNCGLTMNELWMLLGCACFGGMTIGVVLMCILQVGRANDAFWEEE